MNKNKFKLNFHIVKSKDKKLSEDVSIFRTTPTVNGYYLLLSSDLRGEDGTKETAVMGNLLKVTSKQTYDKTIPKPTYFKDNQTGQFGWGYFLPMNATEEKTNQILNNLRELKKEYYKAKKMEPAEDTGNLSLNDVKELRSVVNNVQELEKAIENAADNTENSEIKNRLEQYFQDLQRAIEDDTIFLFLIDNYERAKKFQTRNTAWNYSLLNSLIITVADPTASLAGPKDYWEGVGYKIKDEFTKNGIVITKPKSSLQTKGKSDIPQKVKWAKENPDVIRDFLQDQGYSMNEPIEGKEYQLAKYITSKGLYGRRTGGFETAMVYTNNMVEAIPGREIIEPEGDADYNVLEKDYEQNLTPLFNAILTVCEKTGTFIPEPLKQNKEDLKNFNRVVSALAKKMLAESYGGEAKVKPEDREQLEVRTESVAQIIKNHYGIQSEASKYNIAALGADRESLERSKSKILNTADKLINQIDSELKNNIQESKIRKIVSKLIRENFSK
jgi:hypothetical protein